ncbi:radical SAM/SPASM domain-containing protein [Gorillibacterium sp. sgz500922]|uniref:radical SAM protein n=1 Tax=Gorillibacterium sp. sgz500922 TaxID=3446694 RepID=UPI003F67E8A4
MIERNYSSIRLEVTSKCNIHCLYCHNSEFMNKTDDLRPSEVLELIRNLKAVFPIKKILLTGGEPLLHPGIVEIVQLIRDLGIKPDMVTNGKLLTDELADELIAAGLKRFRLSIDGFAEHAMYRKGSSADDLWTMAGNLVKKGNVNVCVHTVCSPHNVDTLYEIYQKVLQTGVHRWRVFDIGYKGGVLENKDQMGLEVYYDKYFDAAKRIVEDFVRSGRYKDTDIEISNLFKTEILGYQAEDYDDADLDEVLEERLLDSPCDYISHQLTIRSNGQATFCQYYHHAIYDFAKHGLNVSEAVAHANPVLENDSSLERIRPCNECKYVLLCNSGCRARAEYLTGNALGADPVGCFMIPRMIREIAPVLPGETQRILTNLIVDKGKEPIYTQRDLEVFLKDGGFLF